MVRETSDAWRRRLHAIYRVRVRSSVRHANETYARFFSGNISLDIFHRPSGCCRILTWQISRLRSTTIYIASRNRYYINRTIWTWPKNCCCAVVVVKESNIVLLKNVFRILVLYRETLHSIYYDLWTFLFAICRHLFLTRRMLDMLEQLFQLFSLSFCWTDILYWSIFFYFFLNHWSEDVDFIRYR